MNLRNLRLTLIVCGALFSSGILAQHPQSFERYTAAIPGSKVTFTMVPVPAGNLILPPTQTGTKSKTISLSAFWMGKYEITHDEFELFLKDENIPQNSMADAITRPSPQYIDLTWGMGREGGFPANSMQQMTALMYCKWLYDKTGIFYRLPTEAEWQYAAIANAPVSKNLDKIAWHKGNTGGYYQKVGQKEPNAWGLYDMLGNVAEWTLDQWTENWGEQIGTKDPLIQPEKPRVRTVRGGSFESDPKDVTVYARVGWKASWNKRDPQIPKSKWWLTDGAFTGFRIVRPLQQPTPAEIEAFFNKHIQY